MNNILLFISIISTFTIMLIIKKYLGKEGLIGWICIASILANLILTKSVDLLGMSATLGNVLFASVFLANNMLIENYGYGEAKKGVKLGLLSVIMFVVVMQFALLYIPNTQDIAHGSFQLLFEFIPRIALASIILFGFANFLSIKIYEGLRKITKGKYMWFRNNICTIICNGGENFLFYIIAFLGVIDMNIIVTMAISATLIEVLIALCDTPFLYLSKRVKDVKQ